MKVKQFEDKNLAHYSYAIVSKGEMAVIDPSRDPKPYLDYAKSENAKLIAIIETHPHADFVSSHLELHKRTGATIYVSKLLGAFYEHDSFDEGEAIVLGEITLKAINTPGHSPDSISVVAIDQTGESKYVFTGDTLFIGDCGRPDLREGVGAITLSREELAKQMYSSLRNKLMTLPDETIVYPAHGSGSLCGKALSKANSSTIGEEKKTNWSLKDQSEKEFVYMLLADQPFIPKYFGYDVDLNRKGADNFENSVESVEIREPIACNACIRSLSKELIIIDVRSKEQFNRSHIKGSVNLMDDTKLESWLGSIVGPEEKFYLGGGSESELKQVIARIAKIGYEKNIEQAFVVNFGDEKFEDFNLGLFADQKEAYTILDIRNSSEVQEKKIFDRSINIPLYELRERVNELPVGKPILVHCAGGYRSAAGRSIVLAAKGDTQKVCDLSDDVKKFYQ